MIFCIFSLNSLPSIIPDHIPKIISASFLLNAFANPDWAINPLRQLLIMFYDFFRQQPVWQSGLTALSPRVGKGMTPESFKVSTIAVINFKIEPAIRDDGENHSILIDPPPSKHGLTRNIWNVPKEIADNKIVVRLIFFHTKLHYINDLFFHFLLRSFRRREDSNLWYSYEYSGFQDRCNRPLCHASMNFRLSESSQNPLPRWERDFSDSLI